MIKKNLPNMITCLNLLVGCIGIVYAFNDNLVLASYLVGLAAIFDFMDGMVARLLHAYSEIGKQLDSLADMVSFGVLPSVIAFQLLIQQVDEFPFLYENQYLLFLPFLMAIFSALRLAKFNIDTRQTSYFIGLPTPANALFWASLPLMNTALLNSPFLLVGAVLLLSGLLVAPLPLFSLKLKSLSWKQNELRFVFLAIAIILIGMYQIGAIPYIIGTYVLLSVIGKKHIV